jgi:hypothetical protein
MTVAATSVRWLRALPSPPGLLQQMQPQPCWQRIRALPQQPLARNLVLALPKSDRFFFPQSPVLSLPVLPICQPGRWTRLWPG